MATFESLIVWQKARLLFDDVAKLFNALPFEQKTAIGDQMNRAALSVCSNIAEGRGRQTAKQYAYFLHIAKGSLDELQAQLQLYNIVQQGMEETVSHALSLATEISKMLFVLERNIRSRSAK